MGHKNVMYSTFNTVNNMVNNTVITLYGTYKAIKIFNHYVVHLKLSFN